MSQKQTGPLQNLFVDIKKIIDNTEFKDLKKAKAAESTKSAANAELWILANLKRDSYVTYKNWWTRDMFREVSANIKTTDYNYYIENPYGVPYQFHATLLERGRQAFLNSFVEENSYYRTLMGLPSLDDTDYIYLSEELQTKFHVGNIPVHELSIYVQNKYIDTDEYENVLNNNPDKKYLKYLGMNKVDLYAARTAKDFEIIRYPKNRADINPNLLRSFEKIYADCREYIMVTLYNEQLEGIYKGYRDFMGFLILAYALMYICVDSIDSIHSHKYTDDTMVYTILSMYGIPDSLLLPKNVRRDLAIHIMRLVKEKGTKEVYYDIIKILGYTDVIISKLMLMKGQKFVNGIGIDEYEPYFIQIDLQDKNPYETIARGNAPKHSYQSIISGDSSWWDGEEVQNILKTKQYSEADSKYIMIEAVIHQMKSMFETIYFTRLILDNKSTDEFMISVPEIFGTNLVSIYDCIIAIICAMCMNNGVSGEIVTDTDKLLATAGFNFDLDIDSFIQFINNSDHLDKARIKSYISNLTIQSESDIPRLFNDVMFPLREWLEDRIVYSENREEFLEYEAVYRALFTYDITRNRFLDDFQTPIEIIQEKYKLSDEEMEALRLFYPHTGNKSITVEDFNGSVNNTRYHYPFLSLNNPVDWYIHIIIDTSYGQEDRGYLYFYDILNCEDLRYITNSSGGRVFMDYIDGKWTINEAAVEKALSLIEKLEDDDLRQAYFQIYTEKSDGTYYDANTKLPQIIRTHPVFKSILYDKIQMDLDGLAVKPDTYFEYLYRKNPDLYAVLLDPEEDRFNRNKGAWMNDVMSIIIAIETSLSMHVKYLEQSALGEELFFKSLITLIKHFKSILVNISKTGLKYVFDDKIDAGGNSNMVKFFDNVKFTIHFSTMSNSGYNSSFGLYDTMHKSRQSMKLIDRSEFYTMRVYNGFASETRSKQMGGVNFRDAMKFYKNGQPMESDEGSLWHNGEYEDGTYADEENIDLKVRTKTVRVHREPVDLEGWKESVPSYNNINIYDDE